MASICHANAASLTAGDVPSRLYRSCFDAIRHKQQLAFVYEGKPRVVCPHVLGHAKGVERLFAYQIGGETSKSPVGSEGEWRCFGVPGISKLVARSGPWRTGSSHKQRQQCVEDVDIDVNPHAKQKFSWL